MEFPHLGQKLAAKTNEAPQFSQNPPLFPHSTCDLLCVHNINGVFE
jgi:hypothetical protein